MKKKWVIAFWSCFSLLIESLQQVLRRGYFEVDDLICNTLGVVKENAVYLIALALISGCLKLLFRFPI